MFNLKDEELASHDQPNTLSFAFFACLFPLVQCLWEISFAWVGGSPLETLTCLE
eukprot:m.170656 g.170656  ORF g.170656 m.170656 type:complete len:54 (+) comp16487_c6_seq1:30-191(+)